MHDPQFSAWDDFKFTIFGLFVLVLPLIFLGAITLFALAFI